ncbi:hypothetical protein VNO77_04457 [Canavalia gladiata]|uniref:Uncharacterized protein n=1 Tax=Canavalia gladiata TaxID=3824 RepID=A0AAN9R7S2_CANGL
MRVIEMASLKRLRITSTLPNRGYERRVTHGELPQLWPRPKELLLVVYMIMKRRIWQSPCRSYVNACKCLLVRGRNCTLVMKRCPCMADAQGGIGATTKPMQVHKTLARDHKSKVVQEVRLEANLEPSDGAT